MRGEVACKLARAEGANPGKLIAMIEPGKQGLCSAHGETRDGARLAFLAHVIGAFNLENYFGEQSLGEAVVVTLAQNVVGAVEAAGNNFRSSVAERHDHQHWLGLSLGDHIVEDHVGAADGRPAAGIVTEAVQKVEHGIALFRFRVIARRRVNEIITLVADHAGFVKMMMNHAVRPIVHLPGQRRWTGHMYHA